jgi:hypothetical protein
MNKLQKLVMPAHVRYVPSRPIQGTKWSTVAMGDIRNICLGIGELIFSITSKTPGNSFSDHHIIKIPQFIAFVSLPNSPIFELFMSHVRYVPSRPIQGTKWSTVAMGDIRNICLGIVLSVTIISLKYHNLLLLFLFPIPQFLSKYFGCLPIHELIQEP